VLTLSHVFFVMGAPLIATAVLDALERRWWNAAFWAIPAMPCLIGDQILAATRAGTRWPAQAMGAGVIALALIAPRTRGGVKEGDPAVREASAARLGDRLFVPALTIPVVVAALVLYVRYVGWPVTRLLDVNQVALISLGIATVVALVVGVAMLRPRASAPVIESRRLLDAAREQIASAIGAQPDEIVFTSGGTESVALAIWGGVRPVREIGHRIVTTTVEHPAVGGVLHTLETDGFESELVEVDHDGRVDLDAFAKAMRTPGTLLASVQHANHEVATMHPVAEAAALAHEQKVVFHTDACQTVGRVPVDVHALDVDLLSLSAHKFGGPAGVGALYVRRGVPVAAYPCGDDRERRRRSGMENIPGVVALGAALAARLGDMADQAARHWAITDRIRRELSASIPDARLYGHPTQRVPHLVCFSVPDLDAEILSMALDDRGFRIAAGSNCSGAAGDPSPVLEHLGAPGTTSFRIGVGAETTDEDVERLLATLPALVAELREVNTAAESAMARYGAGRRGDPPR